MEEEESQLEVPLYSSGEDPQDNNSDRAVLVASKGTINGYKDALFLVLFVFSLLVVAAIALTYGVVSIVNPGADYWLIGKDGTETEDRSKEDISSKLMLGLTFILCLSTVLSLAWVYLLSYVAAFMVNAIVISLVVISVIGAVVVLSLGYPSFGFLLLVIGLVTLLVSIFFQSRLEFASVNLDIACRAIVAIPSTIGYSLLMLLCQALYVLMWSIATIGFATNDYNVTKIYKGDEYLLQQCSSYTYSSSFQSDALSLTCSTGTCHACICSGVLVSNSPCFTPRFYWSSMFGLLLALVWTNAVMVNIVHCTVVAAVARWWTTGSCTVDSMQYFFSVFTSTSLGSICFGSMLGALVRTVRLVVGFLHARVRRSQDNSMLGKINRWSASTLDRLLGFLDRLIVYFNRYAFCYVAIEEHDYIKASYAATALFRARGLTALLNDDILDFIIYISNTFIACITMIAAYIFGKVVHLPSVYLYVLVIFGFFCGFVMGAVVLSTISSAITAVYVCFARDPIAFQKAHPQLYASISAVWSKIFPAFRLQSMTDNQTSIQPKEGLFSTWNNKNTTIHGSYGNNKEVGAEAKPDLHHRELGPNALGLGGKDGNNEKQEGYWSASLVKMIQQQVSSASNVVRAATASSSSGYTKVSQDIEDSEEAKTAEMQRLEHHHNEPAASAGSLGLDTEQMWGTASTMAANFVTDMVIKNPFRANNGITDHQNTNNSQGPPTWTSPAFAPFPNSTAGLHGGYGDYNTEYADSSSTGS